jgi:hypothetical protein
MEIPTDRERQHLAADAHLVKQVKAPEVESPAVAPKMGCAKH